MLHWKQKWFSRKLWSAFAGVLCGLAMAFGLDEGLVSSISGAVVAIVSVVTYIVTEGKIDAAAIQNAAQAIEQAAESLQKE